MNEVSSRRVTGILLLKLDQMGIPRERLVEGLPIALEDLYDPKKRMDWEHFVQLMGRFSALVGGPTELEQAGYLTRLARPSKLVGHVMSLVKEPKQLYWALTKMAGPAFFSNVEFGYEDLGRDHIRITLTIPRDYSDCPEFFYVYKGNLSCISHLHNLPYATVEMELGPRMGVYDITLPPSMTLFKRLKRAFAALRGARGVIEELGVYQQQIKESYDRLAEAKRDNFEKALKIQLFEKLANASRLAALDRLAGGVGHEINNPLMILTLNLDLLASELDEDPFDRKRATTQIRRIVEAKDRIAGIVSSLMAIGAGNPDEAPKQVRVAWILDAVQNLCMAKFKQSDVRLEISPFDDSIMVVAQRMLVSQSLVHLLNNAFDAAMESTDRVIRIEVEEEGAKGGRIRFKVINSGPKIPQSIQERIFDPFFSTREVSRGVGLGLPMARKFIEMQGGELTLDSGREETCFTFALKRAGKAR